MHTGSRARRGSALILTILVVLVLTIIGLGVAYFTQVEDKMSGNDRTSKAGFYASESGLRAGEILISAAVSDPSAPLNFNGLLSSGAATLTPPGGGLTAVALKIGSTTYTNILVDSTDARKGTYSLYIRNNAEDRAPTAVRATTDTDNRVNLISVGTVPGGVTKWIEEQIDLSTISPANSPTQVGGGPGGSGTVTN